MTTSTHDHEGNAQAAAWQYWLDQSTDAQRTRDYDLDIQMMMRVIDDLGPLEAMEYIYNQTVDALSLHDQASLVVAIDIIADCTHKAAIKLSESNEQD